MPPRGPLEANSIQATALAAIASLDESPVLPVAYAAFMLVCGASILSGPSWVLMMAMSLFLLGACLRAAAIDAIERAQQVLMADDDHSSSPVELAAGSPNMFALLRSARVVLLPRSYNAAHMADIEHGASGSGRDTMLLTQLAHQLSRAHSGQVPPWAQPVLPVSQEDLDALPICTYVPSKRFSAARFSQQAQALMSAPGDVEGPVSGGASGSSARAEPDFEEEGGPKRGGCSEGGSSEGGFACSICLEDVCPGDQVMTLPCLHQYHADCVRPWLQRKGRHAACPMCKTPVFS